MSETGSSTSLTDRDQLARLLSFLETDVGIGPGKQLKKRQACLMGGDSQHQLAVLSPVFTSQVQTVYMGGWSPTAADVKKGDTILFPRIPLKYTCTIGGAPISLETAVELKKIIHGSAMHSFSKDWWKSTLAFYCLEGHFPYGIQTLKCGSRGLILCVQGYLLKHLIFDREYNSALLQGTSALSPNNFERRQALIGAITEMLWQAGERKRACACLKNERTCFGPDYRCKSDSITEKLQLFEFKKYDDLQNFVKRNLQQFQSEQGNGCILFLYSLVLSRTIPKIHEDMQVNQEFQNKLLTDMEDISQSLLNLALTGNATPYIHNGELYDRKGQLLLYPLHGIRTRSNIGYLIWDKGDDPEKRTEIGSMLKTPKNPIWVTKVNGQFGLLFSLNPDLVSDWRAENRFTLWYYTGLLTQTKPTVLSIETRLGRLRPRTAAARKEEESRIPALENCIMSKWYGADVNWHGTTPFV